MHPLIGAIAGLCLALPFNALSQSGNTSTERPEVGPPDPKLRTVLLPNGKTLHLLPATLETTQWGWFDNAQPPVLRIKPGDTVALETMME